MGREVAEGGGCRKGIHPTPVTLSLWSSLKVTAELGGHGLNGQREKCALGLRLKINQGDCGEK